MQIHFLPQALAALSCIDEFPANIDAEADVVRTSAPLKIARVRHRACAVAVAEHLRTSIVFLAVAGLDGAFGACARYRVRHCCASDCVDECCLGTT